ADHHHVPSGSPDRTDFLPNWRAPKVFLFTRQDHTGQEAMGVELDELGPEQQFATALRIKWWRNDAVDLKNSLWAAPPCKAVPVVGDHPRFSREIPEDQVLGWRELSL